VFNPKGAPSDRFAAQHLLLSSKNRPAEIPDNALVELIGDLQDEFPGYGYRRVTRELRKRDHLVNHERVARVMRHYGLGIKPRRRFVRTTDSNRVLPVFPNLYENAIPAKPDIVWVDDITYIRIEGGFCYLAAVVDACSRKVVGYAISQRIDSQLALAALEAAVASRKPAPHTCIHHSDRGSQYASEEYRRALERFKADRIHELTGQSVSQRPGGELHENPQGRGGVSRGL
jgi:putative transposase